MSEPVSVCCPLLRVVACADTEDHAHLICTDTTCVISNNTVTELCLGEFENCVNREIDDD